MAHPILFLGVFFLGCFILKFLRRVFDKAFEDDLEDQDYAFESFEGPATTISAGPCALWENNRFQSISSSSEISPSFDNSFKALKVIEKSTNKSNYSVESSNLENSYHESYTKEEHDITRKEKLYISVLNRNRPRTHPKIRTLPTVGNLPTILETFPYPITPATFEFLFEENSDLTLPTEIEPPPISKVESEFVVTPPTVTAPTVMPSNEIETAIMPIIEIALIPMSSTDIKSILTPAIEIEPAPISPIELIPSVLSSTETNTVPPPQTETEPDLLTLADEKPIFESSVEAEPSLIRLRKTESDLTQTVKIESSYESSMESEPCVFDPAAGEPAFTDAIVASEEESHRMCATEMVTEDESVCVPSPIPKKKRKKFRNLRKCLARCFCIRKAKDD